MNDNNTSDLIRIDTRFCRSIASDYQSFFNPRWLILSAFDPLGQDPDFNTHCAAMCLYTSLLIQVNNFDFKYLRSFHPQWESRKVAAHNLLREKPKYKDLSDTDFSIKINEIMVKDIRNCLAHGSFYIRRSSSGSVKYNEFVFCPTKSEIQSEEPITISFDDIFKVLEKKNPLKSSLFDLKSNAQIIENETIPFLLINMARFYIYGNSRQIVDINYHQFFSYLLNYLSAASLVYNQNDYYAKFGPQSNVFRNVSKFRDAFVHKWMHLGDDGKEQSLQNNYKNRNEEILSDVMQTTQKMLLLEAIFHNEAMIDVEPDFVEKHIPISELEKRRVKYSSLQKSPLRSSLDDPIK